jgi:hypothetical protein
MMSNAVTESKPGVFTAWLRNGRAWVRITDSPHEEHVFTLLLMVALRDLWAGKMDCRADLELAVIEGGEPPSDDGEDNRFGKRTVLYGRFALGEGGR